MEGVVVGLGVAVLDDLGSVLLQGTDVLEGLNVGRVPQNIIGVDADQVLSALSRLLHLVQCVVEQYLHPVQLFPAVFLFLDSPVPVVLVQTLVIVV